MLHLQRARIFPVIRPHLLLYGGLIFKFRSSTTTSTATRPSATAGFSAHGVRSNTSLAAVTLANGNRHVYFQETAEGLRRALYSSQSNQWQMSAGGFSVLGAKNDTPLAAAMLKSRTDNNIVGVFP